MPAEPAASPAPKQVTCPTCAGPSVYGPANAYRPFCCKRCRDIDLGAWAAEEFRVPDAGPDIDLQSGGGQDS